MINLERTLLHSGEEVRKIWAQLEDSRAPAGESNLARFETNAC